MAERSKAPDSRFPYPDAGVECSGPRMWAWVAAICHISHSCLDPNDFTVLNCIVKGHASLSPPSLRLRLFSRFTLLATLTYFDPKDFSPYPSIVPKVAAICHISHSCLDPNDFTVLNCIVKGHASLSPPSLRLRLFSRFTLLATLTYFDPKDFSPYPSIVPKVAAICHISHSCLDPNDFTVLNCIVKGHASLSPPSLRLRLFSRFTLLATLTYFDPKDFSPYPSIVPKDIAADDFLHHENPLTWAGVKPTTLGAECQQQTNHATNQPAS
ncbi:hypothetical protein TNCV_1636271 [Trichonephila clavipes]|uniref:Uncharacterized protein n=1 Tax=Trichonephila clavipes TaxID=2585209 RepID=A0A8X6RIG8_TRICX|nr:hypothetical protein TNCV_1636271 [Trichonephila clavipes]